ncbi:MAG TPA: hypothetical protein VE178_02760 [Silvibacterium sp.]|jgi:hypothetical protein|nr:hypothetical protein [Silvibacterium sp.]
MNSAGKIAVLLLLGGIAGCKHKTQVTPPTAAQAPIYTPGDVAKGVPQPQLPPAKPLPVKEQASTKEEEPPPPKPHKPAHHKSKPVETAKDATAQPSTQQASIGQPPDTSPIGQLSTSSDGTSGTPTRQVIQDLITNTENGLKGIKRALTSDEQQTATQIQTFLTKARKALDQDDLDGANTLATKAKVLLDELTKG